MKTPYRLPDGSPCVGGDNQKIKVVFEETKPPPKEKKKLIKSGCLWGVFLFVGLISEIMLLFAAFSVELVDWWYVALRWSVCCSSVLMIYYASLIKGRVLNGILTKDLAERVVSFWLPMYTLPSALIILFNPIIQIPLGKDSWRVVDGMASLVFPVLFILVSRKVVEKNEELVKGAALNELKSHADIMTDQNPINALEKRLTEIETLVSFFEEERHRLAREHEKDTFKEDISRLESQVEDLYHNDKKTELRSVAQFKALQDKIEKLERKIEALKI